MGPIVHFTKNLGPSKVDAEGVGKSMSITPTSDHMHGFWPYFHRQKMLTQGAVTFPQNLVSTFN